jgi:hypothetical protein
MEKEKLADLVGREHVSDDADLLNQYAADHSFTPARLPELMVKPNNSKEVQDLIRLCHEDNTPLIPVSSGEPHFRGDTVPTLGGVVVDMSSMNHIKGIDRLERVAMIEPGVRFGDLQDALHKEGLRLPSPLCPRATKSVMASCLEREPHMIPKYHLDHTDPLLCNEIVFGTGHAFRTGEAGGADSIEEQQAAGRYQKVAMGMQMNLNQIITGSQGSFGIVNWSTVKCELLPQIQKPFLGGSEDLEQLLEMAYRMVRWRLGDEIFILNNVNFAHLMKDDPTEANKLKRQLPSWILFFCIAGYEHMPEERVAYQQKDTFELAKTIGVPIVETLNTVSAEDVLTRATNPSSEPYWKLGNGGGCQGIPFIASLNDVPYCVQTMLDAVQANRFELSNLGAYVQPVCQGHGHHVEFSLYYDADDRLESEAAKSLYLSTSDTLMNNGAFFSRPYDLIADKVLKRDAVSRDALKKVKGILDPNNIMNPGKLCF